MPQRDGAPRLDVERRRVAHLGRVVQLRLDNQPKTRSWVDQASKVVGREDTRDEALGAFEEDEEDRVGEEQRAEQTDHLHPSAIEAKDHSGEKDYRE